MPPGVPGASRLAQRQMLRVGLLISIPVMAANAGYFALTPERGDRPLLWLLLGVAVATSALVALIGRVPRFAGERLMWILYAWVLTLTLLIAASATIDGGMGSPLTIELVLPLVVGAMAFPPRAVSVHGLITVGSVLAAGTLTGTLTVWTALLWSVVLLCTAVIGSSVSLAQWRLTRRLDRLNTELVRLARTDALTGCLNRRGLTEQLEMELSRHERSGQPLALLMLDLDHFKQINDRFGHPTGDRVLADVAHEITESLRLGDVIGRTGGEEFAVLLPGTDTDGARRVAERIRRAVAASPSPAPVTVSIGVAVAPRHAVRADDLILVGDRALYAAKDAGRDHVMVGTPLEPPGEMAPD